MSTVNDFVIRFANVNGSGSASANKLFAKSIFRMGVPMSAKNIFPSNIQGLPTWYDVRVSEEGYLGRREGVDIMVSVNPQSMVEDIRSIAPGGYFVYDNTKPLHEELIREDVTYIGIPLTRICNEEYTDPRLRQLFKNVMYVGALATLLNIDFKEIEILVEQQFAKKPKLVPANIRALQLGADYARENHEFPLKFHVDRRDLVGDNILVDGNTACGLGAVYGGATVASWYPITPSTSMVEAFEKWCRKLRINEDGKNNFAIVQAEDELAAIGMAIGGGWNGARAFTATSGPGVSLMNEFLGLAYFSEIPVVLVDVQRAGPSTGMPTRTQQSDVSLAAYASHGDTKHILLFPSTPTECFDLMADAFDISDRLQTPVMVMTDLELGMNDHMCAPFSWDDDRKYDLGKVLNAEELEAMERYGRYRDPDGDGIPYRTIAGTHPTKGAYVARGTSRDEWAVYTERSDDYQANMERLLRKFETAKGIVTPPEKYQDSNTSNTAMMFFGTSTDSSLEARDTLLESGKSIDALRIKSFPFHKDVVDFVESHDRIFVIEQNRDGQMKQLLVNELGVSPERFVSVLNYDGMPITAEEILKGITL